MNDGPVIRVEGIGKRYRLGTRQRYQTLREAIARGVKWPGSGNGDRQQDFRELWALREVSFEVARGEVLGIVGRNGAGKSTLLKILSRVTRPTVGWAELRGRVGSLLEVGIGFHPELTGRENIFLEGALLGMRRQEIRRSFEEIVAFSELEQFLDTPVKRYSSGMYLRLAFAVAAHLRTEVLLVDEVLAVGDAEFQKKCLGKMQRVGQEGRTVLFVSHNMEAIRRLCHRGILLRGGRVAQEGNAEEVVQGYLASGTPQKNNLEIAPDRHGCYPPGLEIFRVEFLNRNQQPAGSLLIHEPFTLRFYYRVHEVGASYRIGVLWRSGEGVRLATVVNTDHGQPHLRGQAERVYRLAVRLKNPFLAGCYPMQLVVKTATGQLTDSIEDLEMIVDPAAVGRAVNDGVGLVGMDAEWDPPEEYEEPAASA